MTDSPFQILNNKTMDRRDAMTTLGGMLAAGLGVLQTSCSPLASAALSAMFG